MNRLMMLCNGFLMARSRRRRAVSKPRPYRLNDLADLEQVRDENVVPFRRRSRAEPKRDVFRPVSADNVVRLR